MGTGWNPRKKSRMKSAAEHGFVGGIVGIGLLAFVLVSALVTALPVIIILVAAKLLGVF